MLHPTGTDDVEVIGLLDVVHMRVIVILEAVLEVVPVVERPSTLTSKASANPSIESGPPCLAPLFRFIGLVLRPVFIDHLSYECHPCGI